MTINRAWSLGLVAALGLTAAACSTTEPVSPIMYTIEAAMGGGSEVPAVNTAARGELRGTLNNQTREIRYVITCRDLSGPATAAHFHGPASASENAGVQVDIGPGCTTSARNGSATLSAQQMSDLMAGRMYVNVHTARHPGGEIRGQVGVKR
jgi:hypothetical protein